VKEDPASRQAWDQTKKDAVKEEIAPKRQIAKEETLTIKKDLLYRKSWLWVPKGIIQEILESEHNTKVASHMGQDKTRELIR